MAKADKTLVSTLPLKWNVPLKWIYRCWLRSVWGSCSWCRDFCRLCGSCWGIFPHSTLSTFSTLSLPVNEGCQKLPRSQPTLYKTPKPNKWFISSPFYCQLNCLFILLQCRPPPPPSNKFILCLSAFGSLSCKRNLWALAQVRTFSIWSPSLWSPNTALGSCSKTQ